MSGKHFDTNTSTNSNSTNTSITAEEIKAFVFAQNQDRRQGRAEEVRNVVRKFLSDWAKVGKKYSKIFKLPKSFTRMDVTTAVNYLTEKGFSVKIDRNKKGRIILIVKIPM